jgi:hypothetical protein
MNDFTKEELETIATALLPGVYDDHPWDKDEETLHKKIKHMIANYCDHKYQYNTYDHSLQCKKCLTFMIPSQNYE